MKKSVILTAAIALFSTCLISASAATVKNHVAIESAATSYLDMSAYATGYWLEITSVNGGGSGCSASISSDGRQVSWSAPGSSSGDRRITFDGGPSYSSSPSVVPSGSTGFRVEGKINNNYVGIWYNIRYN